MPLVPPQLARQAQAPQGTVPTPLGKGALCTFSYMFWKNDPRPLILVAGIYPGYQLRGINLHYLSYATIRQLLAVGANNPNFSYFQIRANKYLSSSFRSYSWSGLDMSTLRILDAQFLNQMLTMYQADPYQIARLRQDIERQLATPVNQPLAAQLGGGGA